MSRYITATQRTIIETMLKDGKDPKEIAARIGKHFTTVYREIHRGTVLLRDGATWLDIPKYCSDVGQRIQEERSHNKGVSMKINNKEYLQRAAYYIKELHYSPYAVVEQLKKEFPDISICRGTLYNYIYKKVLKGVKRSDLPYNKKPSKKRSEPRRASYKGKGAKTIDERPKAVTKRNLYGDWELDTVVGAKGKSVECFLVFTERAYRDEIIRKIPNRQKASVVSVLDSLERKMGTERFKQTFRTITCDNGVEFADYEAMELSINGKEKRTSVYFCHPYRSGERGSNENNNKFIRRFAPKGCMIENYSEADVQRIEDYINNYPRKMFGGLSSNEMKRQAAIP